LDPVGDCIRGGGFQHGYMEYRVDCTKAVQEPKRDRVGAWLCEDLVRPEELVSKLLRWSGSTEELCLDIGSAPDQEGRGSGTAGVDSTIIQYELVVRSPSTMSRSVSYSVVRHTYLIP